MLDEENWFITDKDGTKKGIIVPVVMKIVQLTEDGDRNSLV